MSKNNGVFYHFTAFKFVSGILRDGITKGIMIDVDGLNMLIPRKGYQWLTKKKDFKQSWCEFSSLSHKRNEVRLTLKFNEDEQKNIIKWLDLCRDEPNDMQKLLNFCGEPDNWFLFKGNISIDSITAINFNPAYIKQRAKK